MQRSLIQWVVYKTTEKQLSPRDLLTARKIVYIGLIILLFAGAFLWRTYVVDAKATELALRETSRGEVDLTSATLRLSLLGSRGVVTCYLWTSAMEKQKKNQWTELEKTVRILTKLQPHYITPWLFQSWNLAYNVSVESDRPADKYFFVTRGIELLAEGERQNLNNPDLRHSIGLYFEHKIGKSDETNVMRSLMQVSMIPPKERDGNRFRTTVDGRQEVNWEEFEKFCKNHPQLCRRLREGIRRDNKREQERQFTCKEAEDVIQFLEDNKRVPSLYKEPEPSKDDQALPPIERFPVLPPPRTPPPPQRLFDPDALTHNSTLNDEIDVHLIARSWYCYSQEPLPEPSDDYPGISKDVTDRVRQRKPRYMATLIFRDHPAKAQGFHAQRLQQEGWFLDEGWAIPGWFQNRGDKFSDDTPAIVGKGVKKWSLEAWISCAKQWQEHGEANLLLFKDDADEANKRRLAKEFNERLGLQPQAMPPAMREEALNEKDREGFRAARFMFEYNTYRQMSNFAHHYNRALVERKEVTAKARQLFYEAETERFAANPERALEKYQDPAALQAWRDKVLLLNREFRHDDWVQEQSCEIQMRYMALYGEQNSRKMNTQAAQFFGCLSAPHFGGACPVGTLQWLPLVLNVRNNPILGGPFDMNDEDNVPLISPSKYDEVFQRMYPNVTRPQAAPPEPAVVTRPGLKAPELPAPPKQ